MSVGAVSLKKKETIRQASSASSGRKERVASPCRTSSRIQPYSCSSGGCSSFFFLSSRRRHTRFDCVWSSDVCSSDLGLPPSSRAQRHIARCPLARRDRWHH